MFAPADFLDLEHTAHPKLFENQNYVWDALKQIASYLQFRLKPAVFAELIGKPFISNRVFVGRGTVVEQGAVLKGPAWIGENCQIRSGCYVRENVIAGNGVVMGNSCEFKNCILFDEAQVPHFNYVGDSILGHHAHLGAGVILSNVKLNHAEIAVSTPDGDIPTGLKKIRRNRRRQNRDRLQFGHQSRLGYRPRLHDLSQRKLPRRPPTRQQGQAAAGFAGNRETLTGRASSARRVVRIRKRQCRDQLTVSRKVQKILMTAGFFPIQEASR